jgi:nitric oxide reductase subunit B
MFNWGHHTYIVPAAPYVKYISYMISMTELLLLGNIIYNWKSSVSLSRRLYYNLPYRFLLVADIWIFLNLTLAILISIPGINFYTHGTHITVAHAMGATIGINTMIAFASVYFILNKINEKYVERKSRTITITTWLTNIFLFLFWISLIVLGMIKGYKIRSEDLTTVISIDRLIPYLYSFLISGVFLFAGLSVIAGFSLRKIIERTLKPS